MKPFLPFILPAVHRRGDRIAAVAHNLPFGPYPASCPKVQVFENALVAYLGGNR